MRCASCDRENPKAAKFCLECGAAFRVGCGACGAELPPESRFCLQCGEAVPSDALGGSDESATAIRALVNLERFEEAMPVFETALALSQERRVAVPNQPAILAGLARCRAELGDLDAARQLLDERRQSQRRLEASFADEIGMDVTRAMLLCGGADVADEIARELAGGGR